MTREYTVEETKEIIMKQRGKGRIILPSGIFHIDKEIIDYIQREGTIIIEGSTK